MRDLKADLEICNAATPGPWVEIGDGDFVVQNQWLEDGDFRQGICKLLHKPQKQCDAQFIAQAREGWPEAIERAIAAEAEVERLKTDIDAYKLAAAESRSHLKSKADSYTEWVEKELTKAEAELARYKRALELACEDDSLIAWGSDHFLEQAEKEGKA